MHTQSPASRETCRLGQSCGFRNLNAKVTEVVTNQEHDTTPPPPTVQRHHRCIFIHQRSNAGLVGLLKPLRLDHSGLLGHQRLQQQGLHLPGVEREPSPRVGVEEGGAPLLHELHERAATGIVGPHGSFQQGEARPVALHGPRPEHLRHRRFLWDDVGPGLGSAAPESAVCLQTVM